MKKVIGAVVAVWALTATAFAQGPDIMILRDAGAQIGVRVTDEDGVTIAEVSPDTPASRAGFKPGDLVVEFDGERIRSAAQFRRVVSETPPNKSVTATVDRNGTRQTLTVTPQRARAGSAAPNPLAWNGVIDRLRPFTLDSRPEALRRFVEPGIASPPRRLGVEVAGLSDQLAAYFGAKGGALVATVDAGTPADQAGLRSGDVITAINGEAIDDPSDVSARVRGAAEGATLEFRVIRDKKELTLKAVLPAAARPGRI